jgi:hypothetical protein
MVLVLEHLTDKIAPVDLKGLVAASASPPFRIDDILPGSSPRGGIIALARPHLRPSPSLRRLSRSGAARPFRRAHHVQHGSRRPSDALEGRRAATADPPPSEAEAPEPRPSIDDPTRELRL